MRITRPVHLLAAPVLLGVLALTGCNAADSEQAAPVAADVPSQAASSSYDEDRDAGVDEQHYVDQGQFPTAQDAPQQGGTYGLAVLAAGDQAELEASQQLVEKFGYTAYVAETGCLQGASEALGLADGTMVSHLLFDTVEQAEEFAATAANYDIPVVGTAQVEAFCLDG